MKDVMRLDEIDLILTHPRELDFEALEDAHERIDIATRAAAHDRHLRGLPWLAPGESPRCAVCGSDSVWGLEFYDFDTLSAPRSRYRLAVRWICQSSDDEHAEMGYLVQLGGAIEEGQTWAEGWHAHLASKRWFDGSFRIELEAAQAYADSTRAATRARSARPFRTTRSPRSITLTIRALVMERDGFKCRRCGSTSDDAKLVVDHIVPVAKGGTADHYNLQTLCVACNAGKGARHPHDHDFRGR